MNHLASILGARGIIMSLSLVGIVVVGIYVGKVESGSSTDPSTVVVVVVNVDHGGGSTPRSRLSSSMSLLVSKGECYLRAMV